MKKNHPFLCIYTKHFAFIHANFALFRESVALIRREKKLHAKINSMGFRTSQMLYLLQNIRLCINLKKTPIDF